MIGLLALAALVSVLVGEGIDALVIAAIVVVNAAIGYVQEVRAEAAALSLRSLLAPVSRVVRGWAPRSMPSSWSPATSSCCGPATGFLPTGASSRRSTSRSTAARVSGLTPAAKAMYAAASAARGRTLLVVATDADVERTTSDARFFFAALEGLSDAEVERVVLPFPSHEVDPYRGLAPHFDIASARARALHALAPAGLPA